MRRCMVLLASDAKVSAVRMTWRGSYCLLRRLVISQGSLYTPASMFLKSCSGKTTDSVSHGACSALWSYLSSATDHVLHSCCSKHGTAHDTPGNDTAATEAFWTIQYKTGHCGYESAHVPLH